MKKGFMVPNSLKQNKETALVRTISKIVTGESYGLRQKTISDL